MSVTIRMKRGGRTHAPYYRMVVIDSRAPRDTKSLEELGIYHPCASPAPRAEIDAQRALEWLYKGATVSDTARKVLRDHGVTEAYAKGVKPEDFAPAAVEEGEEAVATVEVKEKQKPKARRKAEEKKNAPKPEPVAEEAPAAEAEAEAPAAEEAPAADAADEKTEA